MNTRFSIDLFRATVRETGTLTLGQKHAERLLELAEIGLEAKRISRDIPDAVLSAFESHRPERRTRKPRAAAPHA